MSVKTSYFALAILVAGIFASAVALLGPQLGLGENERFLFYRLAGIERRNLAYLGGLLILVAAGLVSIPLLAPHLRHTIKLSSPIAARYLTSKVPLLLQL